MNRQNTTTEAQQKRTCYIAGKITGDPEYAAKFADAARELMGAGFIVLTPSILPGEGFSYDAYIRMSSAMLDECEVVCFLPDWIDSRGAQFEYGRAIAQGKQVMLYEDCQAIKNAPREAEL